MSKYLRVIGAESIPAKIEERAQERYAVLQRQAPDLPEFSGLAPHIQIHLYAEAAAELARENREERQAEALGGRRECRPSLQEGPRRVGRGSREDYKAVLDWLGGEVKTREDCIREEEGQ